MRFGSALRLLALSALLAITSTTAGAQQAEWVEPYGRYALGFQSLGWTGVPSAAHAPNIMAFVRNDSPRDDRMRICFVRQDAVPYSEVSSQATANQILDRWDEARLSQVLSSPVAEIAHARIADVSAIDYRLQRQDLDVMARFFMIPGGAGMDQITISCAFPAPFTDEEIASINAAFNTLRILPRDAAVQDRSGVVRWTSPAGDFSLSIPDDWRAIPASAIPTNTDSILLTVISPETVADNRNVRTCMVQQGPQDMPVRQTQDLLNSVHASWTGADEEDRFDSVTSYSNEIVQGVRVMSLDAVSSRHFRGSRQLRVIFQRPSETGFITFMIHCSATPTTATDEDVSEIRSILSSLSFTDRASP